MRLRTYKLKDTELPYLFTQSTKKNAKTLLFVHATGFIPWLWQPIAEKYIPEYHVLAPFFCGYRTPDMPNGGLSWYTLAKDLRLLCAHLKIDTPVCIGHSMGGAVLALAHAECGLSAEKMLLIEPIFLPEGAYGAALDVTNHPLASKAIKRRNNWQHETELRDYLQSKALYKNWTPEMLSLYIKHGVKINTNGTHELACSPQHEAALFLGGSGYNPWPVLDKVTCPVYLVDGEKSKNNNYIDAIKAKGLFARSEYFTIAGAGHMVPMEKPEEIIALLDKLLA